MQSLKTITGNGINLRDEEKSHADFAFLSLKIGIESYFKTYRSMKYGLHLFDGSVDNETISLNTGAEYLELAGETILHLHHFIELILKRILRNTHPLLADIASEKPLLLKKLLLGNPLSENDGAEIRSIEFSLAFSRATQLQKKNELDKDYPFLIEHAETINAINRLRNRLWHRGTYLMRYDSLDIFFTKYFLPLLNDILQQTELKEKKATWKYPKLNIDFDPLHFLYQERDKYEIGKYAFAKELGRAAYASPLSHQRGLSHYFNDTQRTRAEASAKAEISNVSDIDKCPVCSTKALVIFDEIEEDWEKMEAIKYTWQVECMCCGFQINHHLKNAKEYKIPIRDFWTGGPIYYVHKTGKSTP